LNLCVRPGGTRFYAPRVELPLFEQVADLVRALIPDELGDLRWRAHRRGIKVWFDTDQAPKEHYEAQHLPRRHVDGQEGLAIEVGFHAEHPNQDTNVAAIDQIARSEKAWRKVLGPQPECGVFYGSETWRRVSEAWIEPDLDDPELAFEIAGRLVDYLTMIEPARQQ